MRNVHMHAIYIKTIFEGKKAKDVNFRVKDKEIVLKKKQTKNVNTHVNNIEIFLRK